MQCTANLSVDEILNVIHRDDDEEYEGKHRLHWDFDQEAVLLTHLISEGVPSPTFSMPRSSARSQERASSPLRAGKRGVRNTSRLPDTIMESRTTSRRSRCSGHPHQRSLAHQLSPRGRCVCRPPDTPAQVTCCYGASPRNAPRQGYFLRGCQIYTDLRACQRVL